MGLIETLRTATARRDHKRWPVSGTVRFQEQDPDEDPKIGTLYVKKAASKRLGNPTRIRVTIEAIES